MGAGFKEHGVMLYLDKTLYKAFIRLQSDKGLGRSYAGLLPLVEGLHTMGFLTDEEYRDHVKRYSQPLGDELKHTTWQELQMKTQVRNLDKVLAFGIDDWSNLGEEEKAWYVRKAKEYGDIVPNAKVVLALAEGKQP